VVIRKECQFFYKQMPRCRDPAVNAFMDERLKHHEGDVMVRVLKPDSSVWTWTQPGQRG
jgi:hypothetical protein